MYEKLDGSLCTLYYYQRAWHLSSVGMPDAAGKLPCGLTFAELFWGTLSARIDPLWSLTFAT